MSDSAELRLFIGGWVGGIIGTHIPWTGGWGILATIVFCYAIVRLTWWWSRRAAGRTE